MTTQLIQFTPYVCLFPSCDELVNLHTNACLESLISQVILLSENDETKNEDKLIRNDVSNVMEQMMQFIVINALPPTYIVCDDTECSSSESLTNYISQLESTRANNNPNQNDMQEMFIEQVEPSYTPIFSPSSDDMEVACDHLSTVSTSHMSKFVTTSDLTTTSLAPTNLSNNATLLNDAAVNASFSDVENTTDMLAPAVLAHASSQVIQRTPEALGISVEALENDHPYEQVHDIAASIDMPLTPLALTNVIATPTISPDALDAVPLPNQVDSLTPTATTAVNSHDQVDPTISNTSTAAQEEADSNTHPTKTTPTTTPAPDTTAIFESLAAEIDQMLYEEKNKVEIHAEKKARTTLLTLQHNNTTKSSILQHIETSLVEYSEIYEKAMLFKLYWEAEKAQWQQDNDKIWQDKLAELLAKQQQQQQSQHQSYYMSNNYSANYQPCERCGYTSTANTAGMYGQNDLYTHDLQHETADTRRSRASSHASLALFDPSHPSTTSQWGADAAFEYDLPTEQGAVTVLTPPNQSDVMIEAAAATARAGSAVKPQLPSRPFVIPNKKRSVTEMLDLSTPNPSATPTRVTAPTATPAAAPTAASASGTGIDQLL